MDTWVTSDKNMGSDKNSVWKFIFPRKQAEGEVYETKIEIDYGAPSVRGRVIWGGLEKYGVVWRAGANENTTMSFSKDVTIGGSSQQYRA